MKLRRPVLQYIFLCEQQQLLYLAEGHRPYLGFVHVKDREASLMAKIVAEGVANGSYGSMEEFVSRKGVLLEQLVVLLTKVKNDDSPRFFINPVKTLKPPPFEVTPVEDAYDEIEILNFPVTISMFDLLHTDYRGDTCAKELINNVGLSIRMVGNYVASKHVRTSRNEIMNFGTFITGRNIYY